MKKKQTRVEKAGKEWPGPIRAGFRKLRLNVPIHWCEPGSGISPCGSNGDNDVTTDKYISDVTCGGCIAALKRSGKGK
jgi:hypothetical protein